MNKDINQAHQLINEASLLLKDECDILDMKQKDFRRVKSNISQAIILINPYTISVASYNDKQDEIICFFNTCYPGWDFKKFNGKMKRQRSIVAKRNLLRYFLKVMTQLSLKEVGELTGGADHTTVLHSIKSVRDMLDIKDPTYCNIYNHALSELNKQ